MLYPVYCILYAVANIKYESEYESESRLIIKINNDNNNAHLVENDSKQRSGKHFQANVGGVLYLGVGWSGGQPGNTQVGFRVLSSGSAALAVRP